MAENYLQLADALAKANSRTQGGQAFQEGVTSGQSAQTEAKKAAFQKKLMDAGIIPASAVSGGAAELGINLPEGSNLTEKTFGDLASALASKHKSEAMVDASQNKIAASKEARETISPYQREYLDTLKDNHSLKNDTHQDSLEKDYQTRLAGTLKSGRGPAGVEESKVNQAVHLRTLINQNYNAGTGEFNIPAPLYSELILGLARLTSPGGTVGIELKHDLEQASAQGDLGKAYTYITGEPVSGTPQQILKLFIDSIDRQGEIAQQNRDKYVANMKDLVPSGLDSTRAGKARKIQFGTDYTSFPKPEREAKNGGDLSKLSDEELLRRALGSK